MAYFILKMNNNASYSNKQLTTDLFWHNSKPYQFTTWCLEDSVKCLKKQYMVNKKHIRKWDSERELFYDDVVHVLYKIWLSSKRITRNEGRKKDLGIYVTRDLEPSTHCGRAARHTQQLLCQKITLHRQPDNQTLLPFLEYGVGFYSAVYRF